MSEAVIPRPSYRVERDGASVPWRMVGAAGAVIGVLALAAGGWWAYRGMTGAGAVPVIEADARPFKVRPDDPGGLRVPNQDELILERPAQQRAQSGQPARPGQMVPGAESPDLGGLRAAAQPPRPVAPTPAPAVVAPVQPPVQAAAPGTTAPAVTAPAVTAPAVQAPRPVGRVVVQLGALPTEEAARAEWERLSRLVPELFQGRSPQIQRLDRPDGQAPLFRLRTGGLADQEAATQFCEQVRARRGACVPIRS
jgi:hypothetical protein